jgi:hypothetical protein
MDHEMDKMIDEIKQYHLTDTQTIKERKRKILDKLVLEPSEMKHYQKILSEYRYVDEIDELRIGNYLRFFRLTSETLDLGRGGFLVDIQVQKEQILLVFKNKNRFFVSDV